MELKKIIEALIFASGTSLTLQEIVSALEGIPDGPQATRGDIEKLLEASAKEWEDRGIILNQVAGGYEFRTHPDLAPWIRQIQQAKPLRLSNSAVETLSMIAYRQPTTRIEIESVRGVDSAGVLKNLIDHGLIRVVGRKEEPGRPLLYATGQEFLELFGLRDLADLPPLKELEEMIHQQNASQKPEDSELTVSDLVTSQEDLSVMEESDREVLEELEEKMQHLKEVEKSL